MSDPRFFRKYLDIISEASPAQPTQKQIDALSSSETNINAASDKFAAGDNVGGAVNSVKAANDMANAAGLSFGDKAALAGTAIKAGGRAGLEYMKSRDPSRAAAVAGASVAKDAVSPMDKIVNDPKFDKDFEAGVGAARNNPKADSRLQQMAADYDAGKISADSYKGYVNRASNRAQAVLDDPSKADAMMADMGDDSPNIQHSGLTKANTAELDPMKAQAVQGTLKPVEYTPAPIGGSPQQAAAPEAPAAPAAPVKVYKDAPVSADTRDGTGDNDKVTEEDKELDRIKKLIRK